MCGADIANRLIEEKIDMASRCIYRFAINTYPITSRIDTHSLSRYHRTIYLDTPGSNQLFRVAPGGYTSMCQKTGQSLKLHTIWNPLKAAGATCALHGYKSGPYPTRDKSLEISIIKCLSCQSDRPHSASHGRF